MDKTKEPQYQRAIEIRDVHGRTQLGAATNQTWLDDPRRLVFMLSRYKFAAKMLSGMSRVLEVGCGDAFGTRIVAQEVPHITAIDFDPVFIAEANATMSPPGLFDCRVHDMLASPIVPGGFQAAFSLDVLEHIPAHQEKTFLAHICESLDAYGVVLLGTPSHESQVYASESSRRGHINCKRGPELRALVGDFFHNVFVFSMNDEVVHTGFTALAHYLFALGVTRK